MCSSISKAHMNRNSAINIYVHTCIYITVQTHHTLLNGKKATEAQRSLSAFPFLLLLEEASQKIKYSPYCYYTVSLTPLSPQHLFKLQILWDNTAWLLSTLPVATIKIRQYLRQKQFLFKYFPE